MCALVASHTVRNSSSAAELAVAAGRPTPAQRGSWQQLAMRLARRACSVAAGKLPAAAATELPAGSTALARAQQLRLTPVASAATYCGSATCCTIIPYSCCSGAAPCVVRTASASAFMASTARAARCGVTGWRGPPAATPRNASVYQRVHHHHNCACTSRCSRVPARAACPTALVGRQCQHRGPALHVQGHFSACRWDGPAGSRRSISNQTW